MTARAEAPRIGVVADDSALALIVAAGLGLGGLAAIVGPLAELRVAREVGAVAGIVVLGGGPADEEPGVLRWPADAAPEHALAGLVAAVRARWGAGAAPAAAWAREVSGVGTAQLVAALARLRPDLKLVLETGAGQLGICAVGGCIVSAGLAGEPLAADPDVTGDPSLALVMGLWGGAERGPSGAGVARDGPGGDVGGPAGDVGGPGGDVGGPGGDAVGIRWAEARLRAELGLVCEYAELFARSAGFARHLERVFAATLAAPVVRVHASSHAPAPEGTEVLGLMARVLARMPEAARRGFVPAGALEAPGGLPRWLRGALPPAQFGRLFFALEDGGSQAAVVATSRLGPVEAEVALALGALTGVVVPRRAEVAKSGRRARPRTVPLPEVAAAVGAGTPERMGAAAATAKGLATSSLGAVKVAAETEARLAARDARAAGEPPPLPMDPRACGAPARFFEIVREAALEGARAGRHPRLAGTRFEPVGEALADLLLFFRIGAGGTGDVYLGVQGGHGGFQKTVAVKRLIAERSAHARFRAGFLDEARFGASLEHPNIVQIFRLVAAGGSDCLVMEFVHGVSVAQLTAGLRAAGEPIAESVVRFIGAEVARGLHYLHQRRSDEGAPLALVHRDVAPPNILIGFDGAVKLIDMSIAHAGAVPGQGAAPEPGEPGPGRRRAVTGRLGYMAPEAMAGHEVGPAADLFGLAATLYELLLGEPCFARGTPHTTVEAIAKGEFRPILKARPEVSPHLAYAIERGLARDPASRFKDLAAFREALLRGASETDPAGRTEALIEARFGDLRVRERDAIERMRRSAASHFGGRPGGPAKESAR